MTMEQYAGIDVSLEASHVCVVDAQGKILKEQKVASEPEALIAWFASCRPTVHAHTNAETSPARPGAGSAPRSRAVGGSSVPASASARTGRCPSRRARGTGPVPGT